MAQETIQAIRNAEAQNAQKEKDARDRAAKIVSDARAEASGITKGRILELKDAEDKDLKLAGAQNEEIITRAKEEATAEIKALHAAISAKEPDAIDSVINTLFS